MPGRLLKYDLYDERDWDYNSLSDADKAAYDRKAAAYHAQKIREDMPQKSVKEGGEKGMANEVKVGVTIYRTANGKPFARAYIDNGGTTAASSAAVPAKTSAPKIEHKDAQKLQYYKVRVNDKSLTEGQRRYAQKQVTALNGK